MHRWREGTTCRSGTVSSDRHLEVSLAVVWPASSWLFAESPVPGLACSYYFEASSHNSGSLGHGQSLVIMWLTFSIWWGFEKQLKNICKTAHGTLLRILSIVFEEELEVLDFA